MSASGAPAEVTDVEGAAGAAGAEGAAGAAGEDTAWSTWYVYLHRPAPEQDRFLLDVAAPLLRRLVHEGRASAWHFLRYWAGGPHLRLRLGRVARRRRARVP